MGIGLRECKDHTLPAVLWCLESPIINNRFFHYLKANTLHFRHVFLWSGGRSRVSDNTIFHPIFWPNESSQKLETETWSCRRFAVMVTGNKLPFRLLWSPQSWHPWRLLRWVGSMGINAPGTIWIRAIDPWMRHGLSKARRDAIAWFGQFTDFDLYGQGWNIGFGYTDRNLTAAVKRCYRGTLPYQDNTKIKTIAGYRFCLCFENTKFPGYITEKIFDAFFAGTIPVYLGAPDIASYVWPETFVDARRFASLADLGTYLSNMPEGETHMIREAAQAFIASKDFRRFCSKVTANLIVDALEETRCRNLK